MSFFLFWEHTSISSNCTELLERATQRSENPRSKNDSAPCQGLGEMRRALSELQQTFQAALPRNLRDRLNSQKHYIILSTHQACGWRLPHPHHFLTKDQPTQHWCCWDVMQSPSVPAQEVGGGQQVLVATAYDTATFLPQKNNALLGSNPLQKIKRHV